MSLVEILPLAPTRSDSPFVRRAKVYALDLIDAPCAEYVRAYGLHEWERAATECVAAMLRAESPEADDGFVTFGVAS